MPHLCERTYRRETSPGGSDSMVFAVPRRVYQVGNIRAIRHLFSLGPPVRGQTASVGIFHPVVVGLRRRMACELRDPSNENSDRQAKCAVTATSGAWERC